MAIKILNDLLPVAEQTEVGVVKPDNVSITVTQDGELQSVVVDLPEEVVTSDNYVNAKLWKGTLEEYNAIETKDPLVTYIVTDDNVETLKTTDYNRLDNKPSIENVTLEGNKTLEELNIQSADTSLTTSQITNCITKIPQDINLELSTDSTLILKAGSKLYYPNGFEIDGVTKKFDTVVKNIDISRNAYLSNSSRLCVGTNTSFEFYPSYFSGTTANRPTPSSDINICYYDTDLNKMFVSINGADYVETYLSLPFALVSMNNGAFVSIDQVFNGFGYIGSTIFALPGVEGLIPNGRNPDGSLNNTKFTTNTVLIYTITNINYNGILRLGRNIIQTGALIYNKETNYNYNLTISPENIRALITFGTISIDSNGQIISFLTKTTFQTVDRNDTEWVSVQGKPSNKYVDLTLGASGSTYIAPANGWVWLRMTANNVNEYIELVGQVANISRSVAATNIIEVNIPVKKSEQFIVYYSASGETDWFKFVYDEGVQ